MAKQCYQIPVSYALWAVMSTPQLHGVGETTMPDGTKARDGAGFGGQFWVNALWLDQG